MTHPLRLAETLASRLCHDLIAPLGAAHTGIELFSTTPSEHSTDFEEILQLVLQSTEAATSKASFFRAAFGKSGDTLSFKETFEITKKYLKDGKLHLDVDSSLDGAPFTGGGRLFLTALLWLAECAPKEGELSITAPVSDTFALTLCLKADPLILQPGILEILEEKATPETLSPRTIPCYFMWQLLQEKQGTFSFSYTPGTPDFVLNLRA